jgi:DNA topoisomerase-2
MAKTQTTQKIPVQNTRPEVSEKFIDDFLNTDVKNYAQYVVTTRAIPSIMDGMRIGGRKIMWAILNGDLKRLSKTKMVNVIGDTMKYEFHHGDSSLKNTIEQLASEHLFECAPLKVIGQKGSLRVPDASTAARYLEVATTKWIDLFKTDMDLLELNFEDGKNTEPKFFLPLVPVALLWRTNSPGFGFSFRSFSFNFGDVLDATIQSVASGTCTGLHHVLLKPQIVGIKDANIIYNDSKNSWYNIGEYTMMSDMMIITDLPYSVSFEKYQAHLTDLKEKGIISDWFNRKTKTEPIKYTIMFHKGSLLKMYSEKWKFYSMFRLHKKIPNLTLNNIDKDGKSIIYFDNANEMIDGFVKKRLAVYRQRKTRLITLIDQNIIDLLDKAKFIKLVVEGTLVISKRAKSDIEKDCHKFGVTTAGLDLALWKLTQEEIDKAILKIESLRKELVYIKSTSIEQMYINDLIALRAKYLPIKDMRKLIK